MINVTAALITYENKVLITQRPMSKKLGGKWEFPGGKIDQNETPEECLRRELKEELGIETKIGKLFAETSFSYEFGTIRLLTYWAELIGMPTDIQLIEHQAAAWVTPDEMTKYDFADADLGIIEKLRGVDNV